MFLVASLLMIWRLEAMSAAGFEGTVLGTLVMPYCSGMGNLIFAFILGRHGGNGADVMTNSIVNKVTNMTLVLGIPAIIWGINVVPQKKPDAKPEAKSAKARSSGIIGQLNRLSLLLTLLAVVYFSGVVWALGSDVKTHGDGRIGFNQGLVLVGMFLFWQCFHVFEVLKQSARQGHSPMGWMFPVDMALLAVGAYGIYVSTGWLINWLAHFPRHGFISIDYLGWLSGILMVLPNALLAIYYGLRKQPETVYASQVGDAHVSIPLCVGIFALCNRDNPMSMPPFFQTSMIILLAATFVHLFCVAIFGRLPRLAGVALVVAYGIFLWTGLLKPIWKGIALRLVAFFALRKTRRRTQRQATEPNVKDAYFTPTCFAKTLGSSWLGEDPRIPRDRQRAGAHLVRQFHERNLRRQPARILGDAFHAVAGVVADQEQPKPQDQEALVAGARAVPHKFKIARPVMAARQRRPQRAEVARKILKKIIVAWAGVRQNARAVFHQ